MQKASDPKKRDVLPKHNCLVLSPANVWTRDKTVFQNDPKLVESIFRHTGKAMEAGPSVKGEALCIFYSDTIMSLLLDLFRFNR